MNRFISAFVTVGLLVFTTAGEAAQAANSSIPIVAAKLTPSKTSEGIRWDARYIVDLDASSHFKGGTIELAAPLPTEERFEPRPGVTPIVDADNHITGIKVEREALHDRAIEASFLGPNIRGAPIARGSAVQIIGPQQPPRMILEVDSRHGFEKHVGYIAPRTIGHSAREEARRLTETHVKISDTLIYVRGDDIKGSDGLGMKLVDQQQKTRRGSIGIAFLFAGVVGALVIAARRLRHSASVERADRILKAEIEGLSGIKKRRA